MTQETRQCAHAGPLRLHGRETQGGKDFFFKKRNKRHHAAWVTPSRHGSGSGSVIKIWNIVVGITAVTLGGIVGDPQVIKAREKNEHADDEHRDCPVWILWEEKHLKVHLYLVVSF